MNAKIPAIAAAVVLFLVLPLAVLGIGLVGALGGPLAGGCGGDGGVGGGSQQIGGRVWSAEQMTNAQTIVARAAALGLPKRAAVIAMSTGIVETDLTNLDHGDKDSLGLFQQRPSKGWGSPAQILNPRASTDAFYDRLVTVPNWQSKPAGVAADLVQSSAHPERYAPQEATAAALVDRFWQGPDLPPSAAPGTVTNPKAPTSPGAPHLPGSRFRGPGRRWHRPAPTTASPTCRPSGPLDRSALPPGFTLPADPEQQRAVAFALAQVGKRYVFGAKGPDTFDCSGLMQAAWAAAGVGISAGTLAQIHDGVAVAGLADLAPGDLLFTPGSLGTPTNPRHVGMYAGHDTVIEAHSTKTGVIVQPLSVWRAKTVAIRRVGGPPSRVRCAVSPSPPRQRPRDQRCSSARGEYAVTQSSPKLISPIADRDLLVMGGVCAFGVAMMAVNVELVLAAGIAAALLGGPLQLSPPDGWIATGVRILADAGDPGAELSPPWTALAGHPVVYWAVAVVLLGRQRRGRDPGHRARLAAVGAHPCRACHPPGDPPGAVAHRRPPHRGVDPSRALRCRTRPGPAGGGRRPAAPRPDRGHVLAVDQPDRHVRADPDRQVPRRPRAQGPRRTRCAAVQHHETRPAGVRRAGPDPTADGRAGAGVRRDRNHPLAGAAALVAHLRL